MERDTQPPPPLSRRHLSFSRKIRSDVNESVGNLNCVPCTTEPILGTLRENFRLFSRKLKTQINVARNKVYFRFAPGRYRPGDRSRN